MDTPEAGPGACSTDAESQLGVTRILAIRHGETAWNAEQRLQGHTDVPLNERGRAQARRLADALGGEPLDAIYSSDLQRARQTAEPVARRLGLEIAIEPGLRERRFGTFEGHTHDEIQARWPEGAAAWRRRDPGFAAPGGEALAEFQARALRVVLRLAAAHRNQTIAVVAHGGVLDALYRAASRADLSAPRTWQLAHAAINRLLLADEGLMLVGWNDNQHLQGL